MILYQIIMFSSNTLKSLALVPKSLLLLAKLSQGRFLSEFPGILVILRRPVWGGGPIMKRQGDAGRQIRINYKNSMEQPTT